MSSLSPLLKKYDIPAPRYTSYPTVPYWSDTPSSAQWIEELTRSLTPAGATWSLYLHIPFCESLCTFCGCNTSITRNHKLELPYIGSLHQEWQHYLREVPELGRKPLHQLHLGGGTPTFLSPESLKALLQPLLEKVVVDPAIFEASFEADPRRTTFEQLQVLRELGFSRLSLGVQDFSPEVQRLINRIQPFEKTRETTVEARRLGYDSINFDLIYGLPRQSSVLMMETMKRTLELRPDRIAFYSLALVPWIKPAQRLWKEEDLPSSEAKRELYEKGREFLLSNGYREIGMDHFALETDKLYQVMLEGKLHRNFMGYADHRTDVLLGLGVSAISETPGAFHQNEKKLPVYERMVSENLIPTFRGHRLTDEDRKLREQILRLMTQWRVPIRDAEQESDLQDFLKPLIDDELVIVRERELRLTEKGKPFLRIACMAFDQRMREKKPDTPVFSRL